MITSNVGKSRKWDNKAKPKEFSYDRDRIRNKMADEIQCWLVKSNVPGKNRPKFAHPAGSEVSPLRKAW